MVKQCGAVDHDGSDDGEGEGCYQGPLGTLNGLRLHNSEVSMRSF